MRKGTKRKAKEVVGKGKAKVEEEQTATTTEEEGIKKNEYGETQLAAQQNESVEEKKKEKPKKNEKAVVKRQAKRAKIVKPKTETEYFPDKRNLEDLWQEVFPVGTEWDQIDIVYQYKWNFLNLKDAFEEGGELHGQKVYLFGCTEYK